MISYNQPTHINMFSASMINQMLSAAGEDVIRMNEGFQNCCGSMMFTRRHVGKDMLTGEVYDEEEQNKLYRHSVPFSNEIYEQSFGGDFCTHEKNASLVPLFQRFHLMMDTQAIPVSLCISQADKPVYIFRSSGALQEGWVNRTPMIRFIWKDDEWVPHIKVSFLQNQLDEKASWIYAVRCFTSHRELSMDEWKQDREEKGLSSKVFQVNQSKLNPEFIDYVKSRFPIDSENNDVFAEWIEDTESFMTRRVMTKLVSLENFLVTNHWFTDFKMKIHRLKTDSEGSDAERKMTIILNELLNTQTKMFTEYCSTLSSMVDTGKFVDSLTFV